MTITNDFPHHSTLTSIAIGTTLLGLTFFGCGSSEEAAQNETSSATNMAAGNTTQGTSTSAGNTMGATSSDTNGGTVTGTTSGSMGGTSTTGGSVSDGQFTINVSLSPQIATVGIVEWSSTASIDSAVLEFGRDASAFEFQVPLDDVTSATRRSLMLGMKEGQTYSGRIVAQSGGNTLTSQVFSIETGFLSNSLPQVTVTDTDASRLFDGFTVSCNGYQSGMGPGGNQGTSSFAFVFDKDGDMVWAYDLSTTTVAGCTTARLSYDGQHMWIGNFSNVSTDGSLMRVTLDGLQSEDYSLPGRHHHFTVLPDNQVLYYEQGNGGGYDDPVMTSTTSSTATGGGMGFGMGGMGFPGGGGGEGEDIIMRLDPETGQSTTLYDENTDFEQQITESGAHTNYISYVPHLDAISFSMRHTDTIVLMKYPEMQVLAVFGGPEQVNQFGISWAAQHGHHFYDDRLLIFNNNDGSPSSLVLEYQYDIAANTATEVFRYDGGVASGAFGEVQKLANGNILVTYSVAGVFHEITADGSLLREIVMSEPIGYARRRTSLYGSPPPFAD